MLLERENKNSKNYSLHDLASFAGCNFKNRRSKPTEKKDSLSGHTFSCFGEKAFSFFYMIDYSSMEYEYISEGILNVLGNTSEFYQKQGLQYSFECIHPEDRAKLKAVHKKIFEVFYSLPVEERRNLKFDFNIRMKRFDNETIHLLHQTTFTNLSEFGEPSKDFTTCTDITRYKNDNNIRLTIYKFQHNSYKQIFEYDIPDHEISLTRRQIEIMELVSQGYTSKQIAEKLFISFDTVKNHRRNIISSTHTKNMAETMKVVYGKRN